MGETPSWLWLGQFQKEGKLAKKIAKKASSLVK